MLDENLAMWLITFIGLVAILVAGWICVEDIRARHGYLHIEGHTEYGRNKDEGSK